MDDGFAKSSNPAADIRQPGLSVGASLKELLTHRAPKQRDKEGERESERQRERERKPSSCMHVHKPQAVVPEAPAISEKWIIGGTVART